ncbi:unnamed protein product [Darwinula stevensoni]|uniref:Nitroreductase domain-containing protein n=1 Tax=Darwinula stevensoni TaxID=69355 RepID=A0A7R9FTG8_9CRUS|nr:unnamed protein product [Darwinula stevensoni]CAG0905505.1 unnamed protein product [Darwinula stevensoni]
MKGRRSVRHFSDKEVPEEVINNIIMTAASAPSGAHKQPWTFCVIKDPALKAKIRVAAEKEEYENYHGRMSEEWLKDLEKFETDWKKEFLTTAPCLMVIFKKAYDLEDDGSKSKNYYVSESVGIAAGGRLSGPLADAIDAAYGSKETFMEKFGAAAMPNIIKGKDDF